MRYLNLARHPFVNARPVRRAGLLMLLLALVLVVFNGMLYWEHFTGESQNRSRSQELTRMIESEEAEVDRLRDQFAAIDVDRLNRRTRFVNREIDRRRFSWSRLFDRLVQAQPGDVRLVRMTPKFADDQRGRSRERAASGEVVVDLSGVARNGEAILEFIDNLFEHPAFREPDISGEAQRDDDTVSFNLTVIYDPDAADEEQDAIPESSEEESSGDETIAVADGDQEGEST